MSWVNSVHLELIRILKHEKYVIFSGESKGCHGNAKREVYGRSVVPKRNNGLMLHCYIRVRLTSVLPKRNNGLLTYCYIWERLTSFVPKRYNESLIHCSVWVRLMPIVPKLNVNQNMKLFSNINMNSSRKKCKQPIISLR